MAQKVQVLHALTTAGDNKAMVQKILDTWNRLVALTYGGKILESQPLTENIMIKEYEKIKHLRPEFKIEKDKRGDPTKYKVTIKGLTTN